MECIDFFEEGFVGKNALNLVISPEDRHLNSKGAKIISKSLFEKLKPLKTFNDRSQNHCLKKYRMVGGWDGCRVL